MMTSSGRLHIGSNRNNLNNQGLTDKFASQLSTNVKRQTMPKLESYTKLVIG